MPSQEFEHSLVNQNYLGTTRYSKAEKHR